MYIPIWIIVIAVIIYLIYQSQNKKTINNPATIESIENGIAILKNGIFNLEHFDSPHFLDYQNFFDVMEINYLKLKNSLFHNPEKVLEIAKDWYRYVESLHNLKSARLILDVDWNEGSLDRFDENMKEPSIIKEQVEKKFKSLLDNDFQKLPLGYFERIKKMKKPKKELEEKEELIYYYKDCENLYKLLEQRREKEEKKIEFCAEKG